MLTPAKPLLRLAQQETAQIIESTTSSTSELLFLKTLLFRSIHIFHTLANRDKFHKALWPDLVQRNLHCWNNSNCSLHCPTCTKPDKHSCPNFSSITTMNHQIIHHFFIIHTIDFRDSRQDLQRILPTSTPGHKLVSGLLQERNQTWQLCW